MPEVTLELVQAKQSELGQLIQQLLAQAGSGATIEIDECSIELQPGEHYAGALLDADGEHNHHLVLMAARPSKDLTWQQAVEWAASVTGELPDRQEAALLFANCKPHLKAAWHWTSETHETEASCAWGCDFGYGDQDNNHKSYEGSAVAVRRV